MAASSSGDVWVPPAEPPAPPVAAVGMEIEEFMFGDENLSGDDSDSEPPDLVQSSGEEDAFEMSDVASTVSSHDFEIDSNPRDYDNDEAETDFVEAVADTNIET